MDAYKLFGVAADKTQLHLREKYVSSFRWAAPSTLHFLVFVQLSDAPKWKETGTRVHSEYEISLGPINLNCVERKNVKFELRSETVLSASVVKKLSIGF